MTPVIDSLAGNDSLRFATEQLFLANARFGPLQATDTLHVIVPPTTAADLFGEGSQLVVEQIIPSASQFTHNPLFQALVLLLAVIYTLTLYYHTADIRSFFIRTSTDSYSDGRSVNYSHFLNLTCMLGLLMIGVLCVKFIGLAMPKEALPANAAAGVSLIATAALMVIVLIQSAILSTVGLITLSLDFIRELNLIRRTALAVTTIITAPALLFYLLTPPNSGVVWLYILVVETFVVLLIFLQKSLMLFISKKISILHWILYLCIVEVFPISLLWLLIIKQ